jgi:hypothetical protein
VSRGEVNGDDESVAKNGEKMDRESGRAGTNYFFSSIH